MIQLILHLRNESEWTFLQIVQYLKCSIQHVARLYYDGNRERN
jgi:hypothetical protein